LKDRGVPSRRDAEGRSSFLTTKKKVDPKTAQTALRQSSVEFTLNKYTQTDNDELLAAQNLMLDAIFKTEPRAIQ
jgi:hypothetical protein